MRVVLALVFLLSAPVAASGRPLPECHYDDALTQLAGYEQWHRTLVDTALRLPADYAPPDLVPASAAGLADERPLRSLVIPDLAALLTSARQEGVEFELQSAYRSYAYQEEVFASWVAALGRAAARRVSARPGHSEHQLGTALDLRSAGGPAPWELDDWARTPEGAWLQENAWRFGFVMSYPAGAASETCYDYEPWHYRYVGREAAAEIVERGITLREWLWEQQPGTSGGSH